MIVLKDGAHSIASINIFVTFKHVLEIIFRFTVSSMKPTVYLLQAAIGWKWDSVTYAR
jgi:hypothetical protein